MKNTSKAMLAIAAGLMFASVFIGCLCDKIQVIYNDNVVTNSVPVKGFNNEQYVWEGWQLSTNKVDSID